MPRSVPRAPDVRFAVEPGDIPAEKAARRLHLTHTQFEAIRTRLFMRGFPRPDPDTGMYCLEAIDRWLPRHRRVLKDLRIEVIPHQQRLAMDAERAALTAHVLGTVYVIGFDSYIKIGFTAQDLSYRLRDLQIGIPVKPQIFASLPGKVAFERELHARFAAYRLEGEWFRREGELAAWIAGGCPVDAP